MSAILDTNVWLDWLVFEDPVVKRLRESASQGRVRLMASLRLRAELADVLGRPALLAQVRAARARRGLPPDAASTDSSLAAFDSLCTIVDDGPDCGLSCSDPDDQAWLDLAVAQHAHWLITKDRDLLKLAARARRLFQLQIVRPADYPG